MVNTELIIAHFNENFKFFTDELKLPKETVYKVTTKDPSLLLAVKTTLENNIKDWIKFGISYETLIAMFIEYPMIILLGVNSAIAKVRLLGMYGFSKANLLEIGRKFPAFLGYSCDTLTDKIDKFKILVDYTDEDIVKMFNSFPQIVSLDFEKNIKRKYDIFVEQGYTKEEIRIITSGYPTAFGNSEQTLTDKLVAINNGGLKKEILENPRNLIQSAILTKARSLYYHDYKDEVTQKKGTFIFLSNANFKRTTSLTKKDLLEKYKERLKVA